MVSKEDSQMGKSSAMARISRYLSRGELKTQKGTAGGSLDRTIGPGTSCRDEEEGERRGGRDGQNGCEETCEPVLRGARKLVEAPKGGGSGGRTDGGTGTGAGGGAVASSYSRGGNGAIVSAVSSKQQSEERQHGHEGDGEGASLLTQQEVDIVVGVLSISSKVARDCLVEWNKVRL